MDNSGSVGGAGVISVAANIMPRLMDTLVTYIMRSDLHQSRTILHDIHGFCRALLNSGSNPAPIKAVMNRVGMDVGACRKPLVDLTDRSAAALFYELRKMKDRLSAQQIHYDKSLMDFHYSVEE
jgi:4-hydroxy-tetrahydrodipicolinate synthase